MHRQEQSKNEKSAEEFMAIINLIMIITRSRR